ncbi:hypothetical protein PIB30_050428 [Stylosanthes scabra]|uniref:Uncharacterized protein n=1 Tax=Stylosanthes scabra TaxID=79078 RepID=A0ABU6ZGE3_9FABA|nr:hypothetical protein [Stylosanthes scabra]
MIQEEKNPDPENYNNDLDAIATSLEIQVNEEVDADLDSTMHSSINSLKLEADNLANSGHSSITNVESETNIIVECMEFLTPTMEIQKSPSHQKQEDEDDQSTTVVVQRPPPEPPDLNTPTKELFPIPTPDCQNVIEVVENEYGIHSGTEDGAVAKGKVEHADLALAMTEMVNRPPPKPPHLHLYAEGLSDANHNADLTNGDSPEYFTAAREERTFAKAWVAGVATEENSQDLWQVSNANEAECSAEVGASAKEKQRASVKTGMATVRGGRIVRLAPSLVAWPLLLLAAIFPWDLKEVRIVTEQEGMAFQGVVAAGRDGRHAPWKGGDRVSVVEVVEELSWVVMNLAEGLVQRTTLLQFSLSRNENANGRELLTPMLELGLSWMSKLQAQS